ncbi:MAG: tetratricopeptide repeat protein [Candidatus Hydrogenedens sp.]
MSKETCNHFEQTKEGIVLSLYEKIFYCFLLICITFLAYANTLNNDWVWDDASSVLMHKHVQNPEKIFQLFLEDQHAFGRGKGNFYRPLVSVSFMVDYLLSYKHEQENSSIPVISPLIFHITNSLWHACVVILVFLLLSKLKAPFFVSFWTSVVYAVHPIPTEAVTYISGRADMMSAVFLLGGVLSCIQYLQEEKRLRKNLYLIACPLFFALGLLSKESSNIFPLLILFIIPLTSRIQNSQPATGYQIKKWFPLLLSIIVSTIYILLRMSILNFSEKSVSIIKTWSDKVVEIGQSFAFYIRILFFPFGLHMEQTLENTPYWTALPGYSFLIIIGIIGYWAWKNNLYQILTGILWFLITWFPISGFFTLNAPQAEHWMYTPMIGFWWCVFELIHYFIKSLSFQNSHTKYMLPVMNILLIILTLSYFYLTYLRNQDWKDNETIFRSTLHYNPNTTRVRYNLAVTYEEIMKNYPGAKREYQELIKTYDRIKKKTGISEKQISFMNEEEIETWLSSGKTLFYMGKFNESIEHLTPVSFLVKQKNFVPYGIEALWYIAQSSLALGDIKTYQMISSRIQTADKKLLKEIQKISVGGKLSVSSYMPIEN